MKSVIVAVKVTPLGHGRWAFAASLLLLLDPLSQRHDVSTCILHVVHVAL